MSNFEVEMAEADISITPAGDSYDNFNESDKQTGLCNLNSFVVKRVLKSDAQRKTIFVEGLFTDREGKAVLLLEKQPFDEQSLNLVTSHSNIEKQFVNDVYGNYDCYTDPIYNRIKTTLIFPATDKHIKKFESHPIHIIEETKEFYESITLPHFTQDQFNLQWVYNILDHKSEVERIVVEDQDPQIGFVLLPDLKWDGKQVENLYLLAIVRPIGIHSIRDLTHQHLPLLFNVREKVTKAIEEKYGLDKSQLRVFFHYQPSFYHLHIHFTYLSYEAPGIYTEKAHLLSTVINNIELRADYYQIATLPFALRESDTLFSSYESKGIVKRLEPLKNNETAKNDD